MRTLIHKWGLVLMAISFLAIALPAMGADYDIVINNGRVMDPETMFDSVANVGVKGRPDRRNHQGRDQRRGKS